MTGQKLHIFVRILIPVFMILSACESDRCNQLSCQNGGVCVDGFCECPEGFAGKECEIIIDPCIAFECKNGECVPNGPLEASCFCEEGFEGENCADSWSAKLLGTYTATETCNGGSLQFAVNVVDGPRFKRFTIENFHNKASDQTTAKVVADFVNPTVFNIIEQPMIFGFVKGSGNFDTENGTLNLSYSIIKDADSLNCSAIFVQ